MTHFSFSDSSFTEIDNGPDEPDLSEYKDYDDLQENLNPLLHTCPDQLLKFHDKLMRYAPKGFYPFYFPLKPNGKEPLENICWKNNRKTLAEALFWMRRGYNIGICATDRDCLCIVDVDDLQQVPVVKPTLQVISRKRVGLHNYFFAFDGTAKRNIATSAAGEVRAVWQYVLTPGSYVPCNAEEIARMPEEERPFAGTYTLKNDLPVAGITFDELPEVYKTRSFEMKLNDLENAIKYIQRKVNNLNKKRNGKHRSALWDLDITDVSGVCDTAGKRVPIPSVIHGSDSGHNCSVSRGLMHCWRHSVSHNAFSYLAVLAGASSCERAGRAHGSKFFGVDFRDGQTVFQVWQYAKDVGLIPENDPIPSTALSYYAVKNGICEKNDLIDGYRLPDIAYRIALLMGKQEGLNFGRQ